MTDEEVYQTVIRSAANALLRGYAGEKLDRKTVGAIKASLAEMLADQAREDVIKHGWRVQVEVRLGGILHAIFWPPVLPGVFEARP